MTTTQNKVKARRCRCIAYGALYKGDNTKSARCINRTRSKSGICETCRPLGKRVPGQCGPKRRLARVGT